MSDTDHPAGTTDLAEVVSARALAAYYRDRAGITGTPTHTTTQRLDGRWYVSLTGDERTLAVYRITNQGQLRRLRRWPHVLTHTEN